MRSLKKITPETAIKRACLQYLKARYGRRLWYVNVIGGLGIRPGTPDTLICLDGRFVSIEFKNGNKGRVSDYQKQALEEIGAAGGTALIIRSIDECISVFKNFMPGNQGELF